MDRPLIGISACLLGERVRYDGGHKLDHYLTDTLGQFVEWRPVCPEVECGLPAPREPMRLVGAPEAPRLVTRTSGIDHTRRMAKWVERKLRELSRLPLDGFIFKTRSPSSGIRGVKVLSDDGRTIKMGVGLFGGAFVKRFPLIPAEDEERLRDPSIRENFIERVFVWRAWQAFMREGPTRGGLVKFHTRHKYLLMAHSPRHCSALGRLTASAKTASALYAALLMECMSLIATPKKHANVLQHMAGYFKGRLTAADKAELIELIDRYRAGLVPLVVPMALIAHHARAFDEPYLSEQAYLHPSSAELMLRNHV